MFNTDNPTAGTETTVETPNTGGEGSTQFDVDKSDNVAQIRNWGKGLEKDLNAAKPAREFVETTFGSLDNARVGASVYQSFAGDEFDPDNFYKTLEQLSPERAQKLFEKYAATQAVELSKKEVEKILGGKVSPEEVRLFKQFKESGYGLGEGDDLPDAMKFNPDGTPRSDEEIAFFKNLQEQVKAAKAEKAQDAVNKQTQEQMEREVAIADAITNFANERLNILGKEFEAYGLADMEGDTAETRQEKEFLRQFIINGVSGAFINDLDGSKDYNSAIAHIRKGEGLLARRYENRIETKLLEIMRSNYVGKLLSSLTKEVKPPEVKPEISTTGASNTDVTRKSNKPITGDDIFSKLVAAGQIKER